MEERCIKILRNATRSKATFKTYMYNLRKFRDFCGVKEYGEKLTPESPVFRTTWNTGLINPKPLTVAGSKNLIYFQRWKIIVLYLKLITLIMQQKTALVMSLTAITILLGQAINPAYALSVNYRGDAGTLTPDQVDDVRNFLLEQGAHTAEEIEIIISQMVIVEPRLGDTSSRITIKEAAPGELHFCVIGAVKGPTVTGATITTVRGDGLFEGQADQMVPLDWGTVVIFHGEPSADTKMVLTMGFHYHTIP